MDFRWELELWHFNVVVVGVLDEVGEVDAVEGVVRPALEEEAVGRGRWGGSTREALKAEAVEAGEAPAWPARPPSVQTRPRRASAGSAAPPPPPPLGDQRLHEHGPEVPLLPWGLGPRQPHLHLSSGPA